MKRAEEAYAVLRRGAERPSLRGALSRQLGVWLTEDGRYDEALAVWWSVYERATDPTTKIELAATMLKHLESGRGQGTDLALLSRELLVAGVPEDAKLRGRLLQLLVRCARGLQRFGLDDDAVRVFRRLRTLDLRADHAPEPTLAILALGLERANASVWGELDHLLPARLTRVHLSTAERRMRYVQVGQELFRARDRFGVDRCIHGSRQSSLADRMLMLRPPTDHAGFWKAWFERGERNPDWRKFVGNPFRVLLGEQGEVSAMSGIAKTIDAFESKASAQERGWARAVVQGVLAGRATGRDLNEVLATNSSAWIDQLIDPTEQLFWQVLRQARQGVSLQPALGNLIRGAALNRFSFRLPGAPPSVTSRGRFRLDNGPMLLERLREGGLWSEILTAGFLSEWSVAGGTALRDHWLAVAREDPSRLLRIQKEERQLAPLGSTELQVLSIRRLLFDLAAVEDHDAIDWLARRAAWRFESSWKRGIADDLSRLGHEERARDIVVAWLAAKRHGNRIGRKSPPQIRGPDGIRALLRALELPNPHVHLNVANVLRPGFAGERLISSRRDAGLLVALYRRILEEGASLPFATEAELYTGYLAALSWVADDEGLFAAAKKATDALSARMPSANVLRLFTNFTLGARGREKTSIATLLVQSAHRTGRLEALIDEFEHRLRADPDRAACDRRLLALALLWQGDAERALPHLEWIREHLARLTTPRGNRLEVALWALSDAALRHPHLKDLASRLRAVGWQSFRDVPTRWALQAWESGILGAEHALARDLKKVVPVDMAGLLHDLGDLNGSFAAYRRTLSERRGQDGPGGDRS